MLNHAVVGDVAPEPDAAASGVSWGAILAGAFAAAALSFILVILGFGLGFSSVSPWSGSGLSAQTIGYSTVAWITFTQIAASAIGGYLAGRLRVKWDSIHTNEVYFRDTAHGLLAWAVASLATAALLGSALSGVLSTGAKTIGSAEATVAIAGAVGGAAATDGSGMGATDAMSGYFVDAMLRPPVAAAAANGTNGTSGTSAPATEATTGAPASAATAATDLRDSSVTPAQRAEITRIFANAMRTGALPDADKSYLASLLAKRSGMSQADAEKRVNDTYASYKKSVDDAKVKAQEAADTARKAAAYGSLWMFVALLCGAFIASLSATHGGRMRDRTVFIGREPALSTAASVTSADHSTL